MFYVPLVLTTQFKPGNVQFLLPQELVDMAISGSHSQVYYHNTWACHAAGLMRSVGLYSCGIPPAWAI